MTSAKAPVSMSMRRRLPGPPTFIMRTYIETELPALLAREFPADLDRAGNYRSLDGRAWRAYSRFAQSGEVPFGECIFPHCRAIAGLMGAKGSDALSWR